MNIPTCIYIHTHTHIVFSSACIRVQRLNKVFEGERFSILTTIIILTALPNTISLYMYGIVMQSAAATCTCSSGVIRSIQTASELVCYANRRRVYQNCRTNYMFTSAHVYLSAKNILVYMYMYACACSQTKMAPTHHINKTIHVHTL